MLDGVLEAAHVGGAQAELAGTMQHVYLREAGGDLVKDLSCAVRGIVIDDKEIGGGNDAQNILDKALDVLALVVCWDSYQRFHESLQLHQQHHVRRSPNALCSTACQPRWHLRQLLRRARTNGFTICAFSY